MKNYMDIITGASPTARGAARAADIVAALAPPAKSSAVATSAAHSSESFTGKLVRFVPGVAGAGVGFFAWKKHRVLGALAGHAVVGSAYEFYKGDRTKAVCDLAVEGAGVAGALWYKKRPWAGWLGGVLAGAVATYFVPGSPIKDQVAKLRGR